MRRVTGRARAPVDQSYVAFGSLGGERGALRGLLLAAGLTLWTQGAAAYDRVVTLRWTQPSGIEVTGFVAYVGTESGQYGETRDLGGVPPGADGVRRSDLVLDALAEHHVALASYNAAGASAPSNEVTVAAVPCDPVFCEDGNGCTVDACGDGGCTQVAAADGTACSGPAGSGLCAAGSCEAVECLADLHCSDGNACNGAELCVGSQCRPGSAPSCTGQTACNTSSCDPALGCVDAPKPDGTACDDGNATTVADQCQAGVCRGGAPPPPPPPPACDAASCGDGNACTADACGATGCTHAPVADGVTCDDGSAATTADQCRAGACVGTLVVAEPPPPPPATCSATPCDDRNTCTVDACSTGACVHLPLADGTKCTDGDARTKQDFCRRGKCVGLAVVFRVQWRR